MTVRSVVSRSSAAPAPEAPTPPDAAGTRPVDPAPRPYLHLDETISPVVLTDFDVEAYTRKDHGRLPVETELLHAQDPLPAAMVRALRAWQHLEATALTESRAMLATWTGNEARVTAFLATWLVERYWLASALRDLLPTDPADADDPPHRPAGVRGPAGVRARVRRIHVDRMQPLLAPLWSALAGEAITAGHMARMAIQEATLQAGLQALAPQLHGEARRVVEWAAERHEDPVRFFRAEAIARITRSRREALTARAVLTLTSPLDGGGVPDPDLAAALAVIGTDPDRRAAVHRARFEITRLLPGPDLPQRHLAALPRTGV